MGVSIHPRYGIEMKTSIKMLTAIAVVAVMCVCPLFAAADVSDAYDVTTGESGLSVEMKNLTKEKVDELFTADAQEEMARAVIKGIVQSSSDLNLSGVAISEMSIKKGLAGRVTDDTKSLHMGEHTEYKVTFKATYASVRDIFLNDQAFVDLMKATDINNESTVGDYFEITAKVIRVQAGNQTIKFVKNEAGSFVTTSDKMHQYSSIDCDITAKFIYTKDATEKNVSFTTKYFTETSSDQNTDFDFNGVEPAKATATTVVYKDERVDSLSRVKYECTVGDETKSTDKTYNLGALIAIFGGDPIVDVPDIDDSDMKPPVITLMGISETNSIFEEAIVVPADENAMSAFVAANGSKDTSYSAAMDIYDDNNSTVIDDQEMLNLLLIGAVAILGVIILVLIVIILIILIVKRKKR